MKKFLTVAALAFFALANPYSIPSGLAVPPAVTSSAAEYDGLVSVPITFNVTASNTPTAYAATNLPPGVTINTTTGVVSGTPTTAGSTTAHFTATNGDGTSTAQNKVFVISASRYNQYTHQFEAVTPPVPNSTPSTTFPTDDPGANGPQKVPIVGGVGGYIPNDSKTISGLQTLLGFTPGNLPTTYTGPTPFYVSGIYTYSSSAPSLVIFTDLQVGAGKRLVITQIVIQTGGTAWAASYGSMNLSMTDNTNVATIAYSDLTAATVLNLGPKVAPSASFFSGLPVGKGLRFVGGGATLTAGSNFTYFISGFIR